MPVDANLQQQARWRRNCHPCLPPPAAARQPAPAADVLAAQPPPAGLYIGDITALEHLQELGITHVVVGNSLSMRRRCRCLLCLPAWL